MPRLGDRTPVTIPEHPLMRIGRAPGASRSSDQQTADSKRPNDPNDPDLWLPGQGQTNACGTTTLAYTLRYLLGDGAPQRESIDRAVRRGNIFSAPGLLADYARAQGLEAKLHNALPLEVLRDLVRREIPTMVLLDTTPLNLVDTANLHWVAVVGMHDDQVAIYNPHGYQEQLDLSSFMAHWQRSALFGLPAWQSLAIAIAPGGTPLPKPTGLDLSALGANLAASGVAGLVNTRAALADHRATPPQFRVRASHSAAGSLRLATAALQTIVGSATLLTGAAIKRLLGRY